jgi:pimeloyl-ACP methyl ester carboxylesterase
MSLAELNIAQRTTAVNGIRLHVVESGEGPAVVLLHGFPEFWYSWRHQLRALPQFGFRAVAPDLRGYNQSDCPEHISSYRTNSLVADLRALIEQLASDPVYVVGHDWGGIIAWRLAAKHPNLVRRLAILNAAHPSAFQRELRRNPGQWFRSFYVMLFQLPWLPETILTASNFQALERGWRSQPVHPTAFTDEDIDHYKEAFRTSGLRGPLNYYRAALRYRRDVFGPPQTVNVPTLVIWGQRDPFMSASVNEHLSQWVPNVHVHTIADASHWVQNDTPNQVNGLLVSFFRNNDTPTARGQVRNAIEAIE